MKTRLFTAVMLSSLIVTAVALCGCSPQPDPGPERTPPAAEYTVPESFSGDPNGSPYATSSVPKKESPLAGKTIYWLGSSVTYGANSNQESMADFLAAKTGCICKKDAVSGTTIFDDGKKPETGERSYTRRLMNSTVFDKTEKVDAFICQISTNDARTDRLGNWGELTPDDKLYLEEFDLTTTLGGAEAIVAYVTDTWQCPVYFYSGAWFGDTGKDPAPRANDNPTGSNYGKLVDQFQALAEKWQRAFVPVKVIDLFHDEAFRAVASDAYYEWAMHDPIHPYKAGYLQWWMPYFEQFLLTDLDLY